MVGHKEDSHFPLPRPRPRPLPLPRPRPPPRPLPRRARASLMTLTCFLTPALMSVWADSLSSQARHPVTAVRACAAPVRGALKSMVTSRQPQLHCVDACATERTAELNLTRVLQVRLLHASFHLGLERLSSTSTPVHPAAGQGATAVRGRA